MSIVKGLKDLNKALDKPTYSGGDENKGRWLKIEDGESVKIRFLQELDPDIDMTPSDILMQYVSNSFPTARYEEYVTEDGSKAWRPVRDSAGNIVEDPQAVEARDKLLEDLASIEVPEGPLEQIINHFGSLS